MLTKLQTLASLFRELGFRWSAFRVAYAFRLRTGLIRLQIPQYKWTDRPLETWLKKNIPSESSAYAQWRKQNSPKFFFESLRPERSKRSPSEVEGPWNNQTAIDEADRILNGEIKYFAHEFHQIGFAIDVARRDAVFRCGRCSSRVRCAQVIRINQCK